MSGEADIEQICGLLASGDEAELLAYARAMTRRSDGKATVELIAIGNAVQAMSPETHFLERIVLRVLAENLERNESLHKAEGAKRSLWLFEGKSTRRTVREKVPEGAISASKLLSSLPRPRRM